MTSSRPLTKRQKKILAGNTRDIDQVSFKNHFRMKQLEALTGNQRLVIENYDSGKHLFLAGSAGTGKTFLALGLALEDIMEGDTDQNKVIIVRSVVPTREMGYLPGNEKEKTEVYESPYMSICNELFSRGDAYGILKERGAVEFMTTSFIRGTTINNSIVIIDEIQNLTPQEIHAIFTRIGKNCRVIFAGDIKQSDLIARKKEFSGFSDFLKIIEAMPDFYVMMFGKEDIVRSGLVKSYIIKRDELEESGEISPL